MKWGPRTQQMMVKRGQILNIERETSQKKHHPLKNKAKSLKYYQIKKVKMKQQSRKQKSVLNLKSV